MPGACAGAGRPQPAAARVRLPARARRRLGFRFGRNLGDRSLFGRRGVGGRCASRLGGVGGGLARLADDGELGADLDGLVLLRP